MKSLAAAAVVAILWVAPAAAAVDFVDDDGRPGEKALEWLAERGVIDGCDPPANTRSCSEQPINRAQAAKVLVLLGRDRGLIEPARTGTQDHFVDDDDVWGGAAEPIIGHLADLGVVHGCDPPVNRHFCPYQTLLKGQIAKMAVEAFDLEAPSDYPTPWTDTAGEYFHEVARVAAYHGLVDTSGGEFEGHSEMSRGDFARLVTAAFAPRLCAEDPFTAGRVKDLEGDHPDIAFTAYAYDFETGCAYAMNPDHRQQTASVLKVMVMAGAMIEAQDRGRPLTADERALLSEMIRRSTNPPVRELWRRFGAAPWFREQTERLRLSETTAVGDDGRPWGRTTTSAYDQGRLLHRVLLGEEGLLHDSSVELARELMTSVVDDQTWGVTAGVPSGWTVAQKNGFAGSTTNSVGMVFDEEMEPVYTVVVMSFGWSRWQDGVEPVERIARWVSSELAD